jgi:REP element-mobilizing transposase RayT
MARRPRSELPGAGYFHVTSRGVDRCRIALDEDDYALLVKRLRIGFAREGMVCHAYCVMPNHFHVILDGAMEQVSKAMHYANGAYALPFNRRHRRTGHLFGDRFYARVLRDDEHLSNACTYVWNNPVRAGLCREAYEWPWSGRMLRRPAG